MDLSIIRERLGQVETLRQENKIARQALQNELDNETEYTQVCEELKAVLDKRKRIRETIWSKPETQKIILDIKENREELSTLQEILSTELMEYYSESKSDEIEDHNGEKRKFKLTIKFAPKKDKYDDHDFNEKNAAKVDAQIVNNS